MSDPILPPGIKVGSGIAEDGTPALRFDFSAQSEATGSNTASLVLTPRQFRALVALGFRQLDIIEGRAPLQASQGALL